MRARFPLVVRILAIVILAAGIAFIGISYYRLRNNKIFLMRRKRLSFQKRKPEGRWLRAAGDTKDGRLYLLLKADVDITYSDDHHELEQVSLAVYPPDGQKPDQINALRAIYDHALR